MMKLKTESDRGTSTAGRWISPAAFAGLALVLGLALSVTCAWAEIRDPKGVAVVVGNRNYRNERVPEVNYAHRDAAAFRHYVVEVLGYDPDNVIYLEDADQAKLESVFGNERSHEGVLWRYLDPEGGSDVVVFYSGHGVPGLKDKRSYLLPVNADPDTAEINGYPIDVLYENLSKLREARSVRVFLDACFSGDSDRGMLVRAASPVYVKAELPEAEKKVTVLTAASGQELASWDEKAEHGLFTHHLLAALHGAADDARYGAKDGKVTAAEAKRYLDRHMTRAARRTFGRHQRATLAGDEGVVLAVARDGEFAMRLLNPGDRAPVAVIGAQAVTGGNISPSPAPLAPTVPDHVAAEKALGLKRNARLLIQRGLALLKFEVGPTDSLFGKKTRRAIKAWQEEKGFAATGHLTGSQAQALEEVGREDMARADREAIERQGVRAEKERLAREAAAKRQAHVERQRLAREAAEREKAEAERKRELKRPGRVFRDCAECPEMVVVPPGQFVRESGMYEEGWFADVEPPQRVMIRKAFTIGKNGVTVDEYRTFVKDTGRDVSGGCMEYDVWAEDWTKNQRDWSWKHREYKLSGDRAVTCVSWEDGKAYVEWLTQKTGKGYRLPSEAESAYALGLPVGQFALGRPFGGEWVEDCWNMYYKGAPTDGSARVSGADCDRRVSRGIVRLGEPRGRRRFGSSFRVARTLTP